MLWAETKQQFANFIFLLNGQELTDEATTQALEYFIKGFCSLSACAAEVSVA